MVRKAIVASLSLCLVGLMLAPGIVSAGTTTIVAKDNAGDLGPKYDAATAGTVLTWPDNMPLVQVGYLDMVSWWFSYSSKEKTYTFGMELAKALPIPGSSLPHGYKALKWLVWLDMGAWNPKYNPSVASYNTVQLVYDGSEYVAELTEGGTWGPVLATLPFSVDGSKLEIQFSAASIGDLKSFWIMPCTVVLWSLQPYSGYWDLDSTDPGAAPGQVWWSVPWPPA
jgi:hypothetical protein